MTVQGNPNRKLTIYFPLTGLVIGLLPGIFILIPLCLIFQTKVTKAANWRGEEGSVIAIGDILNSLSLDDLSFVLFFVLETV